MNMSMLMYVYMITIPNENIDFILRLFYDTR